MNLVILQLWMLASTLTNPPAVFVRAMDWEIMAPLKFRAGPFDGSSARAHLNDIIAKKRCDLKGAKVDDYNNLTVNYALLLTPDGHINEVVVEPKDCRPLEALVAAMAITPDAVRRIIAPGGTKAAWYRSRITFQN